MRERKIISLLLNKNAEKIIKLLLKKPCSPNEISTILKMHEQSVYYYIRKLREAGIIDVINEISKRGFLEKVYSVTNKKILNLIKYNEKEYKKKDTKILENIFKEFFVGGYFNGYIVVGSPLQHGPFLTIARDIHYASQLSFILGNIGYINKDKGIIVKLDTEIKAERLEKNNLILIGGPLSNIISYEINSFLKIKFGWDKIWMIKGEKDYSDEECCLIAKVKNPFDITKKVFIIAGCRYQGTRSGIIGITNYSEKIFKNLAKKDEFYVVIKGYDRNGDGIEDEIKVLEAKYY